MKVTIQVREGGKVIKLVKKYLQGSFLILWVKPFGCLIKSCLVCAKLVINTYYLQKGYFYLSSLKIYIQFSNIYSNRT